MQSGKVRTGEDIGAGWIDTTEESIERTKARLAELDELLTEAEKATDVKPDALWDRYRSSRNGRSLRVAFPMRLVVSVTAAQGQQNKDEIARRRAYGCGPGVPDGHFH